MRTLAVAVTIYAIACGSYLAAQDAPAAPQPRYTAAEMRMRIAGHDVVCALADGTERRMNQTVTVDGIAYRCAVILDENLRPTGVAWTPVSPLP
jgi:hypothetical protein